MKKISVLLLVLLAYPGLASGHANLESQDPPSVHGMLLFGREKIYVSHLPMFHSPHDYQVILEVGLSAEGKAAYLSAKGQDAKETVYTIVPEIFSLPETIGKKRPFQARIFKGHFERGGVPISFEIKVEILNVVHFRKLDPNEPPQAPIKYLFFGTKNEGFGAHLIGGKPSFDHILEIGTSGATADLLEIAGSYPVIFPDLPARSPVPAESSPNAFAVVRGEKINLAPFKLGEGIYLEFNDLSH